MWQKFYETNRSNNFEILSIAVDVQGPAVVRPYTEQHGVTFPVAIDASDLFGALFDLKVIPVSFLVDEVGIIRLKGGGPNQEFLSQIEQLLREPVISVRGQLPNPLERLSISELNQKIARDPKDWQARLALARLCDAQSQWGDAIEQLEAANKLEPQESMIPFTWGQILLRQGKKDEALAKLVQARDLDPQNWRIRKQIWAVEHPDKFYDRQSPDYRWQQEQLAREKKGQ